MSRYEKIKRKTKIFTGDKYKKVFTTTIYKKVPEKNTDLYFISQEGDRCDTLAHKFYGDPDLWWYIANVNKLNTMNIPAGISLRIPTRVEEL